MAAPNSSYTQISAITEKKFIPKLVDNIFDSGPLLQRARKKWYEACNGGEKIVQPLNYAQISASDWFSGSETLDTTDNEVITAAEISWKQIYANITVTRIEEIKNSGTAAKVRLVKAKTMIAEKTMRDKLTVGLWSDGTTNPKSIVGLRAWLGTSNTVGGISQSLNSWWQSQLDASTTTLSIPAMQDLHTDCVVDSDQPTVGVATRSIYNKYYGLLQPQQRFTDAATAKGGFSSLMFNGIPIIADSKAPTGWLAFLNENYLHLYYHPDENFRFRKFQEPVDQAVKTAKVFWAGGLMSSNNRLHGALTAITA